MGKRGKDTTQEHSGDREQFINDVNNLPTYQPGNTPYDKYTEKPAPVDKKK